MPPHPIAVIKHHLIPNYSTSCTYLPSGYWLLEKVTVMYICAAKKLWVYLKVSRNSFIFLFQIFFLKWSYCNTFLLTLTRWPSTPTSARSSKMRPSCFLINLSLFAFILYFLFESKGKIILSIVLWIVFPLQFSVILLSSIVHFLWIFNFFLFARCFLLAYKYDQVSHLIKH